ncbi:MAG: hypothetical protein ACJ76N_15445 [Thermoanaerobaculia bacterium]
MATDFPFAVRLPPVAEDGPSDLAFAVAPQPVLAPSSRPLIYETPFQNGLPRTRLFRDGNDDVLRFFNAGDFRLQTARIEGWLEGARLDLAELRFLGPVLSYWFELRGLPTLHASAVVVNGRAVAFVSRHGGGKSGLAAAMVQAGFPLLTDDLLVLEEREDRWEARPSYPEMRMWPDEAAHFVGPPEDLPLVQADSEKRRVAIGDGGFGSFRDASTPLACLYLASRRPETGGDIEIQPVSRSEALIELVRHSFSPRLVEAAGLQPARLDRLARLVRAVPVRRLVYPSGFDRLPEVVRSLHNLDANSI